MSETFSYREYVGDEKFLAEYNSYQRKYAQTIRESDRVLVAMVKERVALTDGGPLDLLDIGCSTGNLLLHIKRLVPGVNLTGGDLALSSIDECRRNSKLEGIAFEVMDLLALPAAHYDIVIVNAVLYMLDDEQYRIALVSLANCLRAGGTCLIYDFAHPFVHQKLTIYETSVLHPNGLRLCFRPTVEVDRAAREAGFAAVEFHPFEIPIVLPPSPHDGEVVTYTVDRSDGGRSMFRGALYQPWCHMVAHKASAP
jgi:SAM-dependent methyltransferase